MNGVGKKYLLLKSYDLTPKQLYLSPVMNIIFASSLINPFQISAENFNLLHSSQWESTLDYTVVEGINTW